MSEDKTPDEMPENEQATPQDDPSGTPGQQSPYASGKTPANVAAPEKENKGPPLQDKDEIRQTYCGRHPWMVFFWPFIVYFIFIQIGAWVEADRRIRESAADNIAKRNAAEKEKAQQANGESGSEKPEATEIPEEELLETGFLDRVFPISKHSMPIIYPFTLGATIIFVFLAIPGYREIPFKISGLSIVIGAVGVVLWVALCYSGTAVYEFALEKEWIPKSDSYSSRTAFDPFAELKASDPRWVWTFVALRLFGYCLIVPIVEEYFLRGFLMRYIDSADWERVPLGYMTWLSAGGIAVYAVASHPEALAAVIWFSMITWLYYKTRNIWDCVAAHAVTNTLLAIYVLTTGEWQLW